MTRDQALASLVEIESAEELEFCNRRFQPDRRRQIDRRMDGLRAKRDAIVEAFPDLTLADVHDRRVADRRQAEVPEELELTPEELLREHRGW